MFDNNLWEIWVLIIVINGKSELYTNKSSEKVLYDIHNSISFRDLNFQMSKLNCIFKKTNNAHFTQKP